MSKIEKYDDEFFILSGGIKIALGDANPTRKASKDR